MNHPFLKTGFCALLLFCCFSSITAAPSWSLMGLSDRSINCILADDTSMILAGTSKGMSVYWNGAWYDFSLALPVTSLARLSADLIAVGAGNGGATDGVYLGRKILKGPPFYQLTRQAHMVEPTAMEFKNTTAIPRLYVGSGTKGVSVFILGTDTLFFERALKIPAYALGVESPYCADLIWFDDSHLFAGGYDQSPNPGTGSLLGLVADSLRNVRRINVTALAKGSFFEVAPVELVVGTVDTGVLLYNPSSGGWTSLSSPDIKGVNDLLVVRPEIGWSDMLIGAAHSGVYKNDGRSTSWTAIGTIAKPPLCLAGKGNMTGRLTGELLAGTSQGVYLYSQTVNVFSEQRGAMAVNTEKPLSGMNGQVTIPLAWSNGRGVMVTIFSASGQSIRQVMTPGDAITLKLPNGMFYYRCSIGGTVMISGAIINY